MVFNSTFAVVGVAVRGVKNPPYDGVITGRLGTTGSEQKLLIFYK